MACRSIQAVGKSFALLFSSHFFADCNLERILSILFEYYASFVFFFFFLFSNLKPISNANKSFFPPLLSNSETMKKWKYYFRLSLKRVELFENFPFSFFSPFCSSSFYLQPRNEIGAKQKLFFFCSFDFFYC